MSHCPYNMVNFGPLAVIVSLVWGTPGKFNGFFILTALLHGTLVVGVSQTAALNRGRHLYSAGRTSRWELAHISSFLNCCIMAKYCDEYVCVSVCVSLSASISPEPHMRSLQNFLSMLPVALARSSFSRVTKSQGEGAVLEVFFPTDNARCK